MTDEEFRKECSQLGQEFDEYEAAWKKRKQELINRYARENARFQIGDIIRANETTIRVDEIYGLETKYTIYVRGIVYVVYRGVILTKKLEPKKSGEIFTIYDDGREITKIEKKK